MTNRWLDKATIYTAAYARVFGAAPSRHGVMFGLSVAEHETRCGDALGGNWGGTTAGQLTPYDRAALRAAGLSPSNEADLPKAQALLGPRPNMILGRDTSAQSGWYWIWFFHPATPVDGAAYFVKVLLQQRPACRAVVDDPTGTLDALARAMYASHYFLGVFNPHAVVTYKGKQMPGDEANIEAYRDAIVAIEQVIEESLAGWVPNGPTTVPTEPPFDLYEVIGYQAALTWLARKMGHPEFDPRGVDGDAGTKTRAAVHEFQTYVRLPIALTPAAGHMDESTRIALVKAIEMASPATTPAPPPIPST
jgi:peptidoglycan hydrolase-like protein with peptidoglycan-binding domain